METRRLDYFVKIVDAGSINRAAALIGMAQPALSQHLAILENELKAKLLDRSPAGVSPTDAGRRLYVRAQVILRQISGLKLELVQDAGAIAGLVAIGLPPSYGAALGNPVLLRARQAHPQLRLQIFEDGATSLSFRLQHGLLDLAISPFRIDDPALDGELLLEEELYLMAAPALSPATANIATLAALPWIVTATPNSIRGHLGSIFAPSEPQPNIVAEVNSLPMVIRAVQQGLGVTLLPKTAVADALADGSVVATSFAEPAPRRRVYLYRRRSPELTASAQAVRALVLDLAAELTHPSPLGVEENLIPPSQSAC